MKNSVADGRHDTLGVIVCTREPLTLAGVLLMLPSLQHVWDALLHINTVSLEAQHPHQHLWKPHSGIFKSLVPLQRQTIARVLQPLSH